MFSVALWKLDSTLERASKQQEFTIDLEELLLVNAYRDLTDFVIDFQQNRTGRPTKRMQKQLTWNPGLDLHRATRSERLAWHRALTINWLYDLVNLFGSIVVQCNMRGEQHVYEQVDW
jgi:hypothetical protein